MSNAVSVSQLISDTGDMIVSSIRNVKGTFNGGGSTSVQKNSDTLKLKTYIAIMAKRQE